MGIGAEKKKTKREKADVAKGKMMIFPGCGGAFHGRCLSRFRFPRRSRAASRTFGVLFGLGQPSLDSTIRMRSESRPDAIVVCSTTMQVYTGSPLYTVPVLCLQKSTQNSTTVPALSFCFRINFLTTSFNWFWRLINYYYYSKTIDSLSPLYTSPSSW